MAQKEKSTKKQRAHKESGHQHGGGGKVYHTILVDQKYVHTDEKGIRHNRTRVVEVQKRGLSYGDAILINGPRGFQPLGKAGRTTKRSKAAVEKVNKERASREARRLKREEKRDA